jgi:hypothetical protein
MNSPDTVLGIFDQNWSLIAWDDDSSHLGDGLASGLYGRPVNPDGSINMAVSGYPDSDFTGAHSQQGPYALYLDVHDPSGGTQSYETGWTNLVSGGVDQWAVSGGLDPGSTFDAYIDNLMSVYDVDFFTFQGLTPGTTFVAEITSGTFDTILGLFDDAGTCIDYNDDWNGLLSRLEGIVPASGSLNLAVTGYADYNFIGEHSLAGDYTLTVTPEPATLCLMGAGAIGMLLRRRRK